MLQQAGPGVGIDAATGGIWIEVRAHGSTVRITMNPAEARGVADLILSVIDGADAIHAEAAVRSRTAVR